MLYEIREYVAVPGRLPELIRRFEVYSFRLFEKHGMEVLQAGVTSVGDHAFGEIVYTLRFADMAELERKWEGFLQDPEVEAMFAETEADGPLVQSVRRRFVNSALFGIDPSP